VLATFWSRLRFSDLARDLPYPSVFRHLWSNWFVFLSIVYALVRSVFYGSSGSPGLAPRTIAAGHTELSFPVEFDSISRDLMQPIESIHEARVSNARSWNLGSVRALSSGRFNRAFVSTIGKILEEIEWSLGWTWEKVRKLRWTELIIKK
jgi:hypothetical protein